MHEIRSQEKTVPSTGHPDRIRMSKTFTIDIKAPVDQVFPLLCPVRELEWVDGWTCDMIYSESGFAEKGCTWKNCSMKEDKESLWVITGYEKNKFLEFHVIVPDEFVFVLSMTLSKNDPETTIIEVGHTVTSINEEGVRFAEDWITTNASIITQFTELSLNHFLKTGQKLTTDGKKIRGIS